MQQAVLKPDVPLSVFQSIKDITADHGKNRPAIESMDDVKNTLARWQTSTRADEWDDGGLNDEDFMDVELTEGDFMDVDALDQPRFSLAKNGKLKNKTAIPDSVEAPDEQKLENGNYACHHRCKDRNACKHRCCKEGLEKKPKPKPKKPKDNGPSSTTSKSKTSSSSSIKVQSKMELPIRRKVVSSPVEHLDLSHASASPKFRVPTAASRLASLHSSTTRSSRIPTLRATSVTPMSAASSGNSGIPKSYPSLNILASVTEQTHNDSPSIASCVEIWDDDNNNKMLSEEGEYLDQDEEMLDAALVGLQDSQSLQTLETLEPTQNAQSLVMLDLAEDCQEDNDEPALFVTPYPQRVDNFPGETQDAVAMFDQNMNDDDSAWSNMIKRKRDEGVSSIYFSAKKARTDEEVGLQSCEEQAQEEERDEESVEVKEKREKEELRAWLAAELGDSVEMV